MGIICEGSTAESRKGSLNDEDVVQIVKKVLIAVVERQTKQLSSGNIDI